MGYDVGGATPLAAWRVERVPSNAGKTEGTQLLSTPAAARGARPLLYLWCEAGSGFSSMDLRVGQLNPSGNGALGVDLAWGGGGAPPVMAAVQRGPAMTATHVWARRACDGLTGPSHGFFYLINRGGQQNASENTSIYYDLSFDVFLLPALVNKKCSS